MSKITDKLLGKLNLNDKDDEEYGDDYGPDEYDDEEEEEEEKPVAKKKSKKEGLFGRKEKSSEKRSRGRSDDYDDEEEDEDYEDEPAYKEPVKPAKQAAPKHRIPGRNNNIYALNSELRSPMKIDVVRPQNFDSVEYISNTILNGISVLVNFESLSDSESQRIVDFLGGVVHAIDGDIRLIADRVFIVTPSSVGLEGDFLSLTNAAMDIPTFNSIEEE